MINQCEASIFYRRNAWRSLGVLASKEMTRPINSILIDNASLSSNKSILPK